MRIVVFGPERRVGAWEGDRVVDLNRADTALPSDLEAFIAAGPAALDASRRAIEHVMRGGAEGVVLARDQVHLHAPAVRRPRIACAAGNYAEHTLGSAARKGSSSALADLAPAGTTLTAAQVVEKTRERDRPRGFWKDFAVPIGPEDAIPYPERAEQFDYEGEVAAVIGARAKDVPKGKGRAYLWGVSLLNDWSIRGQSVKDSLSFNLGKNFDGGASVGPCILVGGDPADLVIETRVNGELRQHYNSGDMIFSHAEYLEYLSRDFTFLPGDMIAGGSGPGSATDSAKEGKDLWLKPGDVVEVSSPDIGTLRNRIVAKR
jgi:2-keto-4-pentenoate hydratase/2-oxohepta-3-ene-1,7-dioic acid hydratase in catechol pathway